MSDYKESLEIAAQLLHLTQRDGPDQRLDDSKVATVIADAIAATYGDFNEDLELSGDPEQMIRGVNVLEKALQQYELIVRLVEEQQDDG